MISKSAIFRRIGCGLMLSLVVGCSPQNPFVAANSSLDMFMAEQVIEQVRYEEEPPPPVCDANLDSLPFALNIDSANVQYWDMTLDEAIQLALSNSSVLRDLGAMVIRTPSLTPTIYDPSIQATDPQFGAESVLSEFDAKFIQRAFWDRNHQALNNSLLGGGTNFFRQDLSRFQSELSKRAVTGAQFTLRHHIDDDLNNAPANIFGTAGLVHAHAWNWVTEAEVRQPLLQGAGVSFNRIAGPNASPGVINGVVIARVDQSISSADFQLAVRNYLSNVENSYWELVYSYRDLDAKKKARDRSLETWQQVKQRAREGLEGAEPDKVAQAAEQYYRFQEEVETALSGKPVDGTRDFSGSTGGTFQGVGGVYVAERRLRLIIGVPINDGHLIRPITEPVPAKVVYNWDQLASNALSQRTEITRQHLRIKHRELELKANRNFLLPRLDAVARYSRRGLGDALYDPQVPDPAMPSELVDSGTNEWQLGVELEVPIGFRRAASAVRNAELAAARERAILVDIERQVIHDLSNSMAEQVRSYRLVETAYNRRVAAETQFTILTSPEVQEAKTIDFNLQLEAIRRLAEADTAYNRTLVGYAVALKNLHVDAGDLLDYCNVSYSSERPIETN